MRTGCGCGCLTLTLLVLLAGALFWLGSGAFEQPDIRHEVGTQADGRRAQQKLFELVIAGSASSRRDDRKTVTLSERELNALIVHHLSAETLPLADMGIRLIGDGTVEVTGRLPLHAFLGDSLSMVLRLLPEPWVASPVWLRLRGDVRLEVGTARGDRRGLRLDVGYLSLGRRRLPVWVLNLLPEGPALRATRWRVPDSVESVTVESGRLTIVVRS